MNSRVAIFVHDIVLIWTLVPTIQRGHGGLDIGDVVYFKSQRRAFFMALV